MRIFINTPLCMTPDRYHHITESFLRTIFMASIIGHIFDWILEHVIYPIMTLGKVDRDWDNNDS